MISPSTKLAVALASRLAAPGSASARGVATFTRSYPSFSSSASSQPRAAFFQQSFQPSIAASLASSESSHTRQSRRTTLIAAAVALAGIVSAYQISSPVHLDAAPPAASSLTSITAAASPSTQVVVDPDTNLAFPLYIPTPASFSSSQPEPRLRLVGLGVRTVSFLRVRVYVAALYIDETHISPPSGETLEQHMKQLLDSGAKAVIRIVPVRNTDFNHLRDGFIRALQARLKKALKRGEVDAEGERNFQQQIMAVKEAFPRGSVPKGSPLDCVVVPRGKSSGLRFEYDGQVFGEGEKKDGGEGFGVARELVLAYFAEQGEISTPFKKSVEEALFSQKGLPTSV